MININYIFKKGILFCYPSVLKEEDILELQEIIKQLGVKKIVINLDYHHEINFIYLKLIVNIYNLINHLNGNLLVCGNIDESDNHRLFDLDILTINHELTAIELLERS